VESVAKGSDSCKPLFYGGKEEQVSTEIQLAPPGAGLPFFEMLLGRLGFLFFRWMTSNQGASRMFLAEGRRMLEIVRTLDTQRAGQRVLIERIMGLEDSSRYWSAYMVLDHLRIVNGKITECLEDLSQGDPSLSVPGIAEVKPDPAAGPDVVGRFEAGLQEYVSSAVNSLGKPSSHQHTHPWFGALDMHGWHCLAAFHQRVHRKQLTIIRDQLALKALPPR
jgi:hypothetical protein